MEAGQVFIYIYLIDYLISVEFYIRKNTQVSTELIFWILFNNWLHLVRITSSDYK